MNLQKLLTLLSVVSVLLAQTPASITNHFAVATLKGSETDDISAIDTDAAGNVYVVGTTLSTDFPVKNAAQPRIGGNVSFRSADRGRTWAPFPNPPAIILGFAAHPTHPEIVFAATRAGIYRYSFASGAWEAIHTFAWPATGSVAIAVDPAEPARMYASAYNNSEVLLVSEDSGQSWISRPAPRPDSAANGLLPLWVDPAGSGAVGYGKSLSRDRGQTWGMARPGGHSDFRLFPDPRRRGWLIAATGLSGNGRLYLTKDWGQTWVERHGPVRNGAQSAVYTLAFDPNHASTIYAVDGFRTLHISADDGETWRTATEMTSWGELQTISRSCGGALVHGNRVYFDFDLTKPPVELNRFNLTIAGCQIYSLTTSSPDAFVAKFAPGGRELLWSTFFGGSGSEGASAVRVDKLGNVFVAGTSDSPDLPTTSRHGEGSQPSSVFVAKFDTDGRYVYSSAIATPSASRISLRVSETGEAYLTGAAGDRAFPVTAGAAVMEYSGWGTGFAAKLGADGAVIYATHLPEIGTSSSSSTGPFVPYPVVGAALPDGSLLVGGYRGLLVRVSSDGRSVANLPAMPGQVHAIELSPDGGVVFAGQRLEGASSSACFYQFSFNQSIFTPPGDIYVRKWKPGTEVIDWNTDLAGECRSWPNRLSIAPSGEVTFGFWSQGAFPVLNPILPFGVCNGSAGVARLSADGAKMEHSTFFDNCTTQFPMAVAPDGEVYAAGDGRSYRTEILRLPVARSAAIPITGVMTTASAAKAYAVPETLLTIQGSGISTESIDVGLAHAGPLPHELGGVRVLFDDEPVGIFRIDADRVIVSVPRSVAQKRSVTVRVVASDGRESAPFLLPVQTPGASFLTTSFPERPPGGTRADVMARNADGTVNGPSNPAALGSIVTMFAVGVADRGVGALLWNAPAPRQRELLQGILVSSERLTGSLVGLWAVRLRIPDGPGPGVYLVPKAGELTRAIIGRVDSGLGIYVK